MTEVFVLWRENLIESSHGMAKLVLRLQMSASNGGMSASTMAGRGFT